MVRDLADPAYEPSDEELQQLSRDAFARVGEQHRAGLVRLRADIERLRVEVLADLARGSIPG